MTQELERAAAEAFMHAYAQMGARGAVPCANGCCAEFCGFMYEYLEQAGMQVAMRRLSRRDAEHAEHYVVQVNARFKPPAVFLDPAVPGDLMVCSMADLCAPGVRMSPPLKWDRARAVEAGLASLG